MKRILTTIAALALVATTAVPAFAGMLDDIRGRNVVRIGVSLGGEPIGFRDDQNNPVGYDVDVAKRLAEKIGVPVEFTDVARSSVAEVLATTISSWPETSIEMRASPETSVNSTGTPSCVAIMLATSTS